MEVTGASNSGVNFVDADKVGFNALTADNFIELLITELQNQDPTEPIGNDELLNQLATMQGLQSNIELSEVLETFSSNQQLTSAATFIGKSVTGFNHADDVVTGVADRVFISGGEVFVGVNGEDLPLSSVSSVSA